MMQLEGFQADRACDLARVSRAGFYRNYEEHAPLQADVELRDLIQRIVLENRFYGYRRVTAELDRVSVNHKRVLRLMGADNLLAVRKQRFALTTDSRHGYAVYSNLSVAPATDRRQQQAAQERSERHGDRPARHWCARPALAHHHAAVLFVN
jgi:transposase InsO family protein